MNKIKLPKLLPGIAVGVVATAFILAMIFSHAFRNLIFYTTVSLMVVVPFLYLLASDPNIGPSGVAGLNHQAIQKQGNAELLAVLILTIGLIVMASTMN